MVGGTQDNYMGERKVSRRVEPDSLNPLIFRAERRGVERPQEP